MAGVDVSLRLHEGDTVVLDGNARRVQAVQDDEIQFSVPGAMMDTVDSREEFEQRLAAAEQVCVFR